jgi:hypothetical protein
MADGPSTAGFPNAVGSQSSSAVLLLDSDVLIKYEAVGALDALLAANRAIIVTPEVYNDAVTKALASPKPCLVASGKSRRGKFLLTRKTRRDSMRARLQAIKQELRQRMHQPIPVQGKWLRQVVKGYFNYHAVPTNSRALSAFRFFVTELWQRSLRRRSQKDGMTWERITRLANDWLPKPRTTTSSPVRCRPIPGRRRRVRWAKALFGTTQETARIAVHIPVSVSNLRLFAKSFRRSDRNVPC